MALVQKQCFTCKKGEVCSHFCQGCTEPDCRDCVISCGDDCTGCTSCNINSYNKPMSSSESYRRTMKLLSKRNVNPDEICDEEEEDFVYLPENQS